MSTDVHEFAGFKFKDGISQNEQIEGFKRREIFFSEPDNRSVDHLVWTSMQAAIASEKVLENPDAAPLFAKIDGESTVFSRYPKIG